MNMMLSISPGWNTENFMQFFFLFEKHFVTKFPEFDRAFSKGRKVTRRIIMDFSEPFREVFKIFHFCFNQIKLIRRKVFGLDFASVIEHTLSVENSSVQKFGVKKYSSVKISSPSDFSSLFTDEFSTDKVSRRRVMRDSRFADQGPRPWFSWFICEFYFISGPNQSEIGSFLSNSGGQNRKILQSAQTMVAPP